jgi:polysaccharide biosynthesis/export protein
MTMFIKSRLCCMAILCAIGEVGLMLNLAVAQESPDSLPPAIESGIEPESSAIPGISSGDRPGWQNAYLLGPGDRIRITALEAPEYSGEFLVLPDGSLDLPRSGNLVVQGMTLEQTKQAIATRYAAFLRRPTIAVELQALRSIRVGISGEVNRPGAYTVASPTGQLPTLTEALQLAGGITARADLRQIQLRRPLRPGQEQVMTISLWTLLETGNLSQDLLLQGGDTIVVPTAQSISSQEAVQLSAASFAPESIKVYVVGEVRTPGAITMQPNAPLNQAILAAGGFIPERAETDEVRLIRLNPDGTASQREIPIDFNQGINDETNPALQPNDVVVVRRSGITNVIDSVSPVFNFLRNILSLIL